MQTGPRVGLAHDYLLVMRGAERTFSTMASCWPGAPIYTLLHDRKLTGSHFSEHPIRTSYLQRLQVRQAGFRYLLPLYPRAIEHLPVEEHDVVVSSSSAFAHGLRVKDGTTHVCYCHSPFRYVWHERDRALRELPERVRPVGESVLARVRRWDLEASRRVDAYIANSAATQERIREFWHRDAPVVHPPVETDRFEVGSPEDYFLVVSELVPHKRVDRALSAARRAGRRVKVVGGGPELRHLQTRFGDSAEFLGRVSDEELPALYARSLALIVPNVEEFGIAAVEAEAAGRPVVAPNTGGTRETVMDGITGVLVPPEDEDALTETLRYVDFTRFSPQETRRHARGFSPDAFRRRLLDQVDRVLGGSRQASPPPEPLAPGRMQ